MGVVAPLVVPFALGVTPFVLGVTPFVLGTALVDLGAGRRGGRGPVPVDTLEVVRERAGRDAEAAEGGRETTGRAEDVPLKDCRDDDREGTDCAEGWRTCGPQVGSVKKASRRCGG